MSSPITFIYFNIGNKSEYHLQSLFSMLTVKKFAPTNAKFVLYTTAPQFYKWSNFLDVRVLSDDLYKDWLGPYNFLWRVKIKAMLASAEQDEGHLLYLDSDTVAFKDLVPLITDLEKGIPFMHLNEGKLSLDRAENKMLFFEKTKDKIWTGKKVDENSCMWNAGVVALPAKEKLTLLKEALETTDTMCASDVPQWLIEQFSLSLTLSYTGKLSPAEDWFAHYWGNKPEWTLYIEKFLARHFLLESKPEELVESLNFKELAELPIDRSERSLVRKAKTFFSKHQKDHVRYSEGLRNLK